MYNCYVTSTYTIRCKASPSFSFNDYCTSCLNERFYKNPISYYSTSLCCNCCNCGRNVVDKNGGFLCPTYLNGLKQSTLIHCAPRKRVILNGFDRFYGSRFTDYDVGRSSYGEYYERKVRGSRLKLGSGRLSSVFSEEECEGRQSHCGGREGFDEVETMIGLLSENVTDEYIGVVERRGKAIKKSHIHGGGTYRGESASKIELETRRIRSREDNLLGRESRKVKVKEEKKKIDDGVPGDASKFEYESKIMRSRKGSMRKKEDEKREVSSGREFQKTRVKEEERGNQLRGKSRAKHVEEETEYLLGENQRARIRKAESENFSRREDELWKARKSRAKHVEEETEHLIRENQRARVRKAESENLSRHEDESRKASKSRAKHVEEETEHLLGENHRARVRQDESENLSRHEDEFRKARKDMSSCSSYYSISSGEFESDDEMQAEQHDIDTGFHSGFQRDSKATHDDKQEFKRHEKYSKESGLVLQKDNSDKRLSGASVGVESSWRKESEKKLTDASVKEAEYIKDSPIKKSRYREHQESSEIDSGSRSKFDHRSEKVSSVVSETTIERNRQSSEAETRMKYKHFKDTSEAFGADYEKTSSSQKVCSNRDEKLSKHANSAHDVKKHHMTADQIRWEQLSKDEEPKVAEIDARGVSSNYRQSETRMKNLDDHSTRNFYDRNEQRQQVVLSNKQVESRIRHERLIDDSSSESISVSREEVDRRSRKQEEKSSFMYSSRLESAESQLESNSKHVKSSIVQSTKPPQESTRMSVPLHLETHISIASSSSQPEAKGSLHVKSPRRLVIEEITAENSTDTIPALDEQSLDIVYHPQASPQKKVHTTKKNEADWQPLKPISHQDALGSGDQLQKSSEHHIDNFFEKVRNEASSSEIHTVNESQKQKLESQYRQHNQATLVSHGSGVSEPKETVSKRSSRSSRSKGPSDEMWHVNEPSVKGPSEEEALVSEGTSQDAVVKRSGKSLWNLIADIVHLRWPRHEDHGGSSKSGRDTSPKSTRSETFISGHDTEESNDSPVQKDKISSTKGSISLEQPKEVEISSTRGEPFHSSSLQAEEEQKGDSFPASLVSVPKESSSSGSMLSSSESSLDASLTASNPKAEGAQSLHPLPSLQIRHAPSVDQILSAELSASESAGQTSQPVSTGSSHDISHEGKDRAVKQRKLQRTDHGVKDRFGDWEEAYRLESEQQKIDEMFMREALVEAKKAADIWEVPVGAVLVQGGKIIARGYNLVEELRDSTAHAEMICIREASNILRSWRLSETTLYVTLEPCPMCAGAILQARVDTVVWGAPNKLLGADGSWIRLFPNGEEASGSETTDKPAAPVHPFHPKLVIRRGVLASECANAMQQFFQRRRKKKEKEEKKPERTGPPSCLPIAKHPSKFLSKMHDAFHLLFCL